MSRENKLSFIKFYPGDWRKDPGVQALDFRDRGIWFEMLILMFESEERGRLLLNGMAMPDDATARLLGITKTQYLKTKKRLLQYNVARIDKDGVLYNERMVNDEKERLILVENGKKGGRPSGKYRNQTHNQERNQTHNQNGNQSSTKSESLQRSEVRGQRSEDIPLPPFEFPPELDTEKFRASWSEWGQHLSEQGKPLTPLAIAKTLDMLKPLGEAAAIEAINHSIGNGWKTIHAPETPRAKPGERPENRPKNAVTAQAPPRTEPEPPLPEIDAQGRSEGEKIWIQAKRALEASLDPQSFATCIEPVCPHGIEKRDGDNQDLLWLIVPSEFNRGMLRSYLHSICDAIEDHGMDLGLRIGIVESESEAA